MSRLEDALAAGRLVVTAELLTVDTAGVYEKFAPYEDYVDAVNATDNTAAHAHASPLAVAIALQQLGMEPVMQLTCRDRNRLALESEIAGAALHGIENICCLTGDDVTAGDEPEARRVFDLDSIFEKACEIIFSATPADRVVALLRDDSTQDADGEDNLVVVAMRVRDEERASHARRQSIGRTITRKVMRERRRAVWLDRTEIPLEIERDQDTILVSFVDAGGKVGAAHKLVSPWKRSNVRRMVSCTKACPPLPKNRSLNGFCPETPLGTYSRRTSSAVLLTPVKLKKVFWPKMG